MSFVESNMLFSFDKQDTYRIEQADIVREQTEIKACECFALVNGRMILIEAKSSSPNPTNKVDFNKFIEEISQKFIDTLLLFNALSIGRFGEVEKNKMPDNIQHVSLATLDYALYLVVHGNKLEWMQPIQDELKLRLKHNLKLWHIPDVNVYAINHEDAKRKGLIEKYLPLDVLDRFKKKGLKEEALRQHVEQWFSKNN